MGVCVCVCDRCRRILELKKTKLYFGFVDLEKAFYKVPREVISWAIHKWRMASMGSDVYVHRCKNSCQITLW